MRATAQVHPAARAVHGDRLVGGQLHHPFGLEAFALLLEEVAHLVARPDLADQRLVAGDDPPHLLLDRRQILVGEWPALRSGREIVVEAVVGRRSEGDLGTREQVLDRFGEDMRIIVADQLERVLLVARRDQRQLRVALERPVEIAHLAIDPGGHRRLGEAGADGGGDVGGGRALGHLANRAVGEPDLEMLRHDRRACSGAGRLPPAPDGNSHPKRKYASLPPLLVGAFD